MDTTSYVIEVNHHYDGTGGGSPTRPNTETAAKPKNKNIGLIDDEKLEKPIGKLFKQMLISGGTAAYSTVKAIGEYTGDYGATRRLNNSIKAATLAASFVNPYVAAMSIIGVSNSIFNYAMKKRDSDFKAASLKQISGGINNGYKGRKL